VANRLATGWRCRRLRGGERRADSEPNTTFQWIRRNDGAGRQRLVSWGCRSWPITTTEVGACESNPNPRKNDILLDEAQPVTSSNHDLLSETLERRFKDGSRKVVLIIGAGLHHHLKSKAENSGTREDEWRRFTDWNGLLASIAESLDLPVIRHEDPASTWETLIVRLAARERIKASDADKQASKLLSERLSAHPSPIEELQRLGKALRQYRDIVNLNLDDVLAEAMKSTGAELKRRSDKPLQTLRPSAIWSHEGKCGRIWQPHGGLHSADRIIMGTQKYGQTLKNLASSFGYAKKAEREWLILHCHEKWTPKRFLNWLEERRSAPEPFEPDDRDKKEVKIFLTWMDLFISSDLVFVGTSLDRAETDLWWALHQRLRNVARLTAGERPRTFALFEAARPGIHLGPSTHLLTAPAGVTPIIFERWDEIWRMLLG